MILGEAAELLGREVAADHLDLDGREPGLALRLHARRAPALELAAVAVRARVGPGTGGAGLLVVDEQERLRVEVALGDPVALELLVHLAGELLDPELVDEHLDARARAVGASQSWRSKTRNTASATFRYSPSSAVTNSRSVGATRGMIEVPPPTRSSKPFTPSRMRGM